METIRTNTRLQSPTGTFLLVFACFTLTSSGYLSWLYHLMQFVDSTSVDALSMGLGYACQGIGIGLAAAFMRSRPEAMGRVALVAIIALHFACAAPASMSGTLAGTLVFGYAMNILCGIISAFYLLHVAQYVRKDRRGIVFGGGYACSVVATWLLSMAPAIPQAGIPNELVSCAAFSVIAVIVTMTTGNDNQRDGSQMTDASQTASHGDSTTRTQRDWTLIALAAITVVLMSMVKNAGFSFPSADLGAAGDLELSRLFYAIGLIIAGFVIDRNRKHGAILCLAALITPFALMALSGETVSGMVLWAIDYLFYGFFSVFRVVLFADLASSEERLCLSGFGLMFGRIGDALGTFVCLSLGGSIIALVTVAAVLFIATVFVFYRLFQQLYIPTPASEQRDERAAFNEFAARYGLSPREREVLRLVLDNQTNAEVAAALFVSESTVKFHMRNALKKTGCKNRVELLAIYAEKSRS